jgi:hypothetical protein
VEPTEIVPEYVVPEVHVPAPLPLGALAACQHITAPVEFEQVIDCALE